jgi:hypothetical protein
MQWMAQVASKKQILVFAEFRVNDRSSSIWLKNGRGNSKNNHDWQIAGQALAGAPFGH